jgi:hypothetical protein
LAPETTNSTPTNLSPTYPNNSYNLVARCFPFGINDVIKIKIISGSKKKIKKEGNKIIVLITTYKDNFFSIINF